MRERLVASFVLLALTLLVAAGAARGYAVAGEIRERESARVHHDAVTVATLVNERHADGGRVDRDFLRRLVQDGDRIAYERPGALPVVAEGPGYERSEADLAATMPAGEGTITVVEDADGLVRDLLLDDPWSVVILLGLALVVAGTVGLLVAEGLSAPFRRLAEAAQALGRGRFDLDLPRTRVPEAAAIARSLQVSADQLRERLHREQEFAAHTSHQLRSPVTGARLELEELTLRDDLPADAVATVRRTLEALAQVDRVAGELVALQRGSLVEGAAIPLRELAPGIAQRWADRLAVRDRRLTAAVDGVLEHRYTPGPVEHVLDLVLGEVTAHSRGGVRLEMAGGAEGHLRVSVTAEAGTGRGDGTGASFAEARAAAEALGGRLTGADAVAGIELLLPRR